MKRVAIAVLASSVAVACLGSNAALADRWHGREHWHDSRVRVGVYVGPGYWYPPPYYYPPRYYYQPVMVAPPAPVTYIERAPEERSDDSYWYYCPDAKAYYPYVKQCPGGWQQVVPQPPSQP